MSSSVSNSGTGPSYQTNFSSSPTDPELDPQAAEKALQALYDGTFSDIAGHMQKMQDDITHGPYGSQGNSGDNWEWAKENNKTPWWDKYEPISYWDDNCGYCPFDNYDQNIVNAPTVTLWASFFGVKTGYSDPDTEGGGYSPGTYHHDSGYTVQSPNDSVSQMIQAMKGKIDIIDTNILAVSGDPTQVQKLNALRCQMQKGLDAAVQLDNWRDSVMAWNVRAGVSNYDMLKPDKYKDGYSTDHLGINWGSTTMDANDRENLLWSKMKAGPNNDDPYPRPPFDPIQLALVCYQTCKDLSSPS